MNQPQVTDRNLLRPELWLTLGTALVIAANMRWGVSILAWFAPMPWLRYLRLTSGLRSRVLFALALTSAWVLATLKIVTAPLPWAFALLGLGFAARELAGYLIWDQLRKRGSQTLALLAFPALMSVLEWAQYRFTSLASWSGAAYTQVDDLPFLQIVSVVGAAGAGFFINWVAAGLEALLSQSGRDRSGYVRALAPLGVVLAIHAWGIARMHAAHAGATTVATVDTPATFGASPVLPDARERAQLITTLLQDTRRAAHAGARLIVWTEAAALVFPEEETAVGQRIAAVARELHVHIVPAYIMPLRLEPLQYENKALWVSDTGAVQQAYLKHHPAPGEPAVVGTSQAQTIATDFGRAAIALCYDYDFPQLAREHARFAVDLVALPSSDWRGIDPIHTQMAALRAIETGASIVRSTRFGLSAGIDAFGRLHASRSSFDGSDRVRVFPLPSHRVATAYTELGDLPVLAVASIIIVLLLASRSRRAVNGRFARGVLTTRTS